MANDGINPHSQTWKTLLTVLDKEYENALQYLIADKESDQQRGKIALIKLLKSLDKDTVVVSQDNYR